MFKINELKIIPTTVSTTGNELNCSVVGLTNSTARSVVNMLRVGILSYTPKFVPIGLAIPTISTKLDSGQFIDDTFTIIKNIKKIKIKLTRNVTLPKIIRLECSGTFTNQITLANFIAIDHQTNTPINIELLNKDLVIANLPSTMNVTMGILMRLGFEEDTVEQQLVADKSWIFIRPNYKPIENVAIDVSLDTPALGIATGYINIKTDGTVEAIDALQYGLEGLYTTYKQMHDYLSLSNTKEIVSEMRSTGKPLKDIRQIQQDQRALDYLNIPVEEIHRYIPDSGTSFFKVYNELKMEAMNTIRDIVKYSGDNKRIEEERRKIIIAFKNIGLNIEEVPTQSN